MRTALGVLVAAAGCLAIAMPAEAALLTRQLESPAAEMPALERKGPWLHVCEPHPDGPRCRYEQTVAADDGGKVVLMLLEPPKGAPPVALFRTPYGVLLPEGLTLKFGRRSLEKIGFRTCNTFGCLAPIPLEGKLLNRMANSSRLTIEYMSEALKPIKAEFSLRGSAAILNGM